MGRIIKSMNGYFSLLIDDRGTFLKLVQATDGGEPININEVMQYLQMQKIMYDTVALGKAFRENMGNVDVFLNPEKIYPVQEMFSMGISEDRTMAICRFYPPSTYGKLMDANEIVRDLGSRGISFGINEQAVRDFVQNRVYCTNMILAQGKAPRNGRDGEIRYFFNTDVKAKPTVNEDGSVDFFHLNTLNKCSEGDVLAELIPEDLGEPGISVFKEKLSCRDIKRVRFSHSHNIQLSEDKLKLISMVNGHVMLVDNKVFVSNVLVLDNVDTSTGNIDYEGSVQVNGNIFSNFTVKSKGNIEVRGVVEGAYLEADGNIIITRGMNGMNKGSLKAGGNIISKFLENATAIAGGYIQTDSILHCNVTAQTEVVVTSKKGFITGGKVSATNCVSVRTLGSQMGSDTVIEIGVDPSLKLKLQQLQKNIVESNNKLKQIEPVLVAMTQKLKNGANLHSDQIKNLQTMAVERQNLKQKIQDAHKELEELQSLIDASNQAQVIVTGEVYQGTKIVISDVSMIVKDTIRYCRFIKRQGEVQMTTI